jgi:tetratricopeptide (TPR) repeat protein
MQIFAFMLLMAVPAMADWSARYRAGEDLLNNGQPENAIKELRSALEEKPGHPAILDALGRAEFQAGRNRSASKYFDQALQGAGKEKAFVLSNAAMASIGLGDSRRAESLVRQALELEPRNVKILKVLAQSLYLQKRYGEAEATFQQILAIHNDPMARGDLATLYQAEHKNDLAIDLLQQAVSEIAPGQARARMLANLGVLQWNSAMREASEKTLKQALREAETSAGLNHPDTARILERYADVLRRTGRKAEANSAARRAMAIRDSSSFQTNDNGLSVDWRDSRPQ